MNNQDFGKFISTLRKEKGLTQKELGEKLNLTDKAISRWENGKSYPDIEMFERIGNELGVSISELIACKRIQTQQEAVSITEKAYIGEVKYRNKTKKVFIVILIILVLFILFRTIATNVLYSNLERYCYNNNYFISEDYECIYYDNGYGDCETYKRMKVENPGKSGNEQYGVGVYIGNVAVKDASLLLKSFLDDNMYIVYSDADRTIIRLDNDFGEDYFYTNDKSLQ